MSVVEAATEAANRIIHGNTNPDDAQLVAGEFLELSARLAQAEQERDEALGVAYLMAGQKEQAEARLREYEKALKKCWACGQTFGEIRRIVEAALGNVKHG